jgi:hypothetical protein
VGRFCERSTVSNSVSYPLIGIGPLLHHPIRNDKFGLEYCSDHTTKPHESERRSVCVPNPPWVSDCTNTTHARLHHPIRNDKFGLEYCSDHTTKPHESERRSVCVPNPPWVSDRTNTTHARSTVEIGTHRYYSGPTPGSGESASSREAPQPNRNAKPKQPSSASKMVVVAFTNNRRSRATARGTRRVTYNHGCLVSTAIHEYHVAFLPQRPLFNS